MNKIYLSLLACAALTLSAGTALAGDAAAGKAKSEACADCHGDDGKGDDETPAIAGMAADKFTAAMAEYKSGARKDAMMAKAAKKLSDEDIANLAAYYASLK